MATRIQCTLFIRCLSDLNEIKPISSKKNNPSQYLKNNCYKIYYKYCSTFYIHYFDAHT